MTKSIDGLGSPPQPISTAGWHVLAGPVPYVLFYGPSYMSQIFQNILCLIPRGEFADDPYQDWHIRSELDGKLDTTIQLKNGAKLRLVSNNQEWQAFPWVLNLKERLSQLNFTHAVFMNPHPQCHFQKQFCVPTGDGVVSDRSRSKNETAQLCFIQEQFQTYFGENWIKALEWTNLRMRLEPKECPSTSQERGVLTSQQVYDPILESLSENTPCSCKKSNPERFDTVDCVYGDKSGHLAVGALTVVAREIWERLEKILPR